MRLSKNISPISIGYFQDAETVANESSAATNVQDPEAGVEPLVVPPPLFVANLPGDERHQFAHELPDLPALPNLFLDESPVDDFVSAKKLKVEEL